MSQIKIDSKLEEELILVYEFLTGKEGKEVVGFLKSNLQSGKTFELIKRWVEETIPKSHENKFQRKLIDILCDHSVLNDLTNEVEEYIKKVVNKVNRNSKDSFVQIEDLNSIARKLDKLIEGTHVLRNKFQELDRQKIFEANRLGIENKIGLEIGQGATTTTLLACIVLISHYYNGVL